MRPLTPHTSTETIPRNLSVSQHNTPTPLENTPTANLSGSDGTPVDHIDSFTSLKTHFSAEPIPRDIKLALQEKDITISQLTTTVQERIRDVNQLNHTVTTLQAQLNYKNTEIASLQKHLQDLANQGNPDSCEQRLQQSILKRSQLEQDLILKENKHHTAITYLQTYYSQHQANVKKINTLNNNLLNANNKVVELSNLTDYNRSQIKTMQSHIDTLNSKTALLSKELDSSKETNSTLINNEKELNTENSNLNHTNSTLRKQVSDLKADQDHLQLSLNEAQSNIDALNSKTALLSKELESSKETNSILINDKKELNTENSNLNHTNSTLRKQVSDLQANQDQLQQSLNEAINQRSKVETRLHTLSNKLRRFNTPNLSSITSANTTPDHSTPAIHNQAISQTNAANDLYDSMDEDDESLPPHNINPQTHQTINMMKAQIPSHTQPNATTHNNNPDPYLMATLLNHYNIRTMTHPELYATGLAAAKCLSKWLNSIDVTVQDPVTKVSLAIKKLDVEILERLKHCNPDLHAITWDELIFRLRSYLSLPKFRDMITELYSQRYEGDEHPSAYYSGLSALRNTVISVYPDNHREIPSLYDLIRNCMISAVKNPWRHILANDLRICDDNLDQFLTKFAHYYDSVGPQNLIHNYRRPDYSNNIKHTRPEDLHHSPIHNPYYQTPPPNYHHNQLNHNIPRPQQNQIHQPPFHPSHTQPNTFHFTNPNRFQNHLNNPPTLYPPSHYPPPSHQANYTDSKPWQQWDDWTCPPCGKLNSKKFFTCPTCNSPCPNQPTDCVPCACGRRIYIQAKRCFYCKRPNTSTNTQPIPTQQIPPPQTN